MSDVISDHDDKRLLQKVQESREKIIDGLMAKGVPSDKADREFLIQTLNGTSSTILAKAKIKSDQTAAQNQAATAKSIAEALLRFKPSKGVDQPPTLPELSLDGFTTNPGESEIGTVPVTFKEIMG